MTALVKKEQNDMLIFSEDKIQLLKDTVCKGASNNELQLFLHVCEKVKLDPFMKQIYSIARRTKDKSGNWHEVRTIQTSIDGYRLIAERTGCYAPGKEPSFSYDNNGRIVSATSYVRKMTQDGTWHEVSATAFMAEYYSDTSFWNKMPHGQLSKCAETLALRKAFPAEFSVIRSDEEMEQAGGNHSMELVAAEVLKTDEPVEIQPSDDTAIKQLRKFQSQFKGEDPDLMEDYITRYAGHHKKTLWEAYTDYKDQPEKFGADFSHWKIRRKKSA